MKGRKRSRHHILPQSRHPEAVKDKANIARIDHELHQKYHSLFHNRTPEEILDFLTNYFWKGKIEFLENYLEEHQARRMI